MTTLEKPRSVASVGRRRRLRIAVVAPPWFEVPPPAYGGIEAMVADLVDGLVDRGHEVCLIGAGPHGTRAQRFVSVYDEPPSDLLGDDPLPEVVHAAVAARVIAEMQPDVVHDNTFAGPLTALGRQHPTVVTAHGPVTGDAGRYLAELGSSVQLVAISDAQRRAAPELNWVGTVPNAIDVSSYPFSDGDDGYLLFIGRMCPEKGAHLAIDAAQAAGRSIVLAGKRDEPAELEYFDQAVRPRLGKGITYLGEADAALKRELYAGAAALLFPISWDEPFGLVMIEAMACGTPVVALRRGSVPEIVDHGTTGFVVDAAAALPGAIRKVRELDRLACRLHVERHFDLPVMVGGYERLFLGLAGRQGAPTRPQRSA